MEEIRLKKDIKITLIDDSYNASPASVKASLEVLGGFPNRKIAVLGDMLELGNTSMELHANLAESILKNNIDLVFLVGSLILNLKNNLPENIACYHEYNSQDICELLISKLSNHDVVLIKGSHGTRMDIVVNYIKKISQEDA